MTRRIERKLRKIGRQGNPDRAFVRTLEAQLRQKVGHPIWWIRWSKFAAVGATALILATSATGVYAYTSDNVLPNHPLYSVRLDIEKVEEALAVTPRARAAVIRQIKKRRTKEHRIMRTRLELRNRRAHMRAKQVKFLEDDQVKLREDRQKTQEQRIHIREETPKDLRGRIERIRGEHSADASDIRGEPIHAAFRVIQATGTIDAASGTEINRDREASHSLDD